LFTVDGVEIPERLASEFAARHPLSPGTAPYYAGGALRRHLMGLTTLSPEVATALAQTEGLLNLDGLTTLSDETAEALAKHEGDLFLDGLTTLSDTAAKALAQHKGGRLHLCGLTTLSPEIATALAASKSWDGSLHAITALDSPDSVAVAEALAKRVGPLKLPNLEKISPKTLAALLEKEDVEIPQVETLELIPEPDGSPTDDFLIPEGFKERQARQRTR
jgi:hypothetical protein